MKTTLKSLPQSQAAKGAIARRMVHGEVLGGDHALVIYDDSSVSITRTHRHFSGISLSASEARSLRDLLNAHLESQGSEEAR